VLESSGRLDEAIDAHQHAIAIQPEFPEAHNNLGIALNRRGRVQEATASFERAVSLRPEYAEAWSNLGEAQRGSGNLDRHRVAAARDIAEERLCELITILHRISGRQTDFRSDRGLPSGDFVAAGLCPGIQQSWRRAPIEQSAR